MQIDNRKSYQIRAIFKRLDVGSCRQLNIVMIKQFKISKFSYHHHY
jgi:hypothetical protein